MLLSGEDTGHISLAIPHRHRAQLCPKPDASVRLAHAPLLYGVPHLLLETDRIAIEYGLAVRARYVRLAV